MNGKKKGGKGKATLSAVSSPGKTSKALESAIDMETVRELARIIGEFGLSEVEADPSGRVRVRRELGGAVGPGPAIMAPPPIALAPPV